MELYSEDVLETNIHHTWWKKEKESKSTEKYFVFDECDEPDSEAEEISDVDSDFDELEE